MAIRLISTTSKTTPEENTGLPVITIKLSDDQSKILVTEVMGGRTYYTEFSVESFMTNLTPKILAYKLDKIKLNHYSMPRMRELIFNTDNQSCFSIVVNPAGDLCLVVGRDFNSNFILTEDSLEPEIFTYEEINSLSFCDFDVPTDRYTEVRRRIISRVYLVDNLYTLEKQVDIQNQLLIEMAAQMQAAGMTLSENLVTYVNNFNGYTMTTESELEYAANQVTEQKKIVRNLQNEAEALIPNP